MHNRDNISWWASTGPERVFIYNNNEKSIITFKAEWKLRMRLSLWGGLLLFYFVVPMGMFPVRNSDSFSPEERQLRQSRAS